MRSGCSIEPPREQIERLFAQHKAHPNRRIYGIRPSGWLREYLAYDPKPDLAAIRSPVLAITGDKDRQIDPADLDTIARIVPGPTEICRMPDLTHLLRREPGPATLRTYRAQYSRPVDAELIDHIATWAATHLSSAPPPIERVRQ
ncbi:hypothetical protein [Nocardia transvalensis]|uniref:hypothetical protein n=1 Tax=Nocardia transvalensis TaxID=37333 RepID=UPI001E4C300E|nr:hypothetical protein [Nocardia transvalensis]